MRKPVTIICYGEDADAAKAEAERVRADGGSAAVRNARMFREEEPADFVVLLPCVSEGAAWRLRNWYGDRIVKGWDAPKVETQEPDADGPGDEMTDDEAKAIIEEMTTAAEPFGYEDMPAETIADEPAATPRPRRGRKAADAWPST